MKKRSSKQRRAMFAKMNHPLKSHGGARVVGVAKHQNGGSKRKRDAVNNAMFPGKRVSAEGKVYYEYRKNRSDLHGTV